jgi:hypothetical protein
MSQVEDIRIILFDIASEFYSEDSEVIAKYDRFIGYSLELLNPRVWGNKLNLGCAYLTAHKLKLAQISDNTNTNATATSSGIVTSEKLGDQQISYANVSNLLDRGYYSTLYGQEFERIRAGLPKLPFSLGRRC